MGQCTSLSDDFGSSQVSTSWTSSRGDCQWLVAVRHSSVLPDMLTEANTEQVMSENVFTESLTAWCVMMTTCTSWLSSAQRFGSCWTKVRSCSLVLTGGKRKYWMMFFSLFCENFLQKVPSKSYQRTYPSTTALNIHRSCQYTTYSQPWSRSITISQARYSSHLPCVLKTHPVQVCWEMDSFIVHRWWLYLPVSHRADPHNCWDSVAFWEIVM